MIYLAGEEGVRHDPAKAAKWFRRAAVQGHASAQTMLADAHREGDGVEQDFEEAARWYREAARGGHIDAPLYLGMMYADMLADMDDDPEAESYLEIAAAAGHEPAQHMLAVLRGEDDFENLDPEEQREIAEENLKEAWAGDVEAQYFIGLAYHSGTGCRGTTPRRSAGTRRRPGRGTRRRRTTWASCTRMAKASPGRIRCRR